MIAPSRRRRVGGLALAIPLVALLPAARAQEPATLPEFLPAVAEPAPAAPMPAPAPAPVETIPDLPGIPADAVPPDRPGDVPMPGDPGVPIAPSPPAPAPAPGPAPVPVPEPASPALPPGAVVPAVPNPSPVPAAQPSGPFTPPPASVAAAATDAVIPTGGLRPLADMASPQRPDPVASRPSEQGVPRASLLVPAPAMPRPTFPEAARTGAGTIADGAGKIACGFGKMLRGTGQMIGSGFHAMGNATERLFGAGDTLMNRGGHRLFQAAQGAAPAPSAVAAPVSPPPPRLVPAAPYPAAQSGP
jgi:hypothetical protein